MINPTHTTAEQNLLPSEEAKYESRLEALTRDFDCIYIDACSLIKPRFEKFFERLVPYLQRYRNRLIIPSIVISEIAKVAPLRLAELLGYLKPYIERYLVTIDSQCDVPPIIADQYFLARFTALRVHNDLALITQDGDLAEEILALRTSVCVKNIRRIQVSCICANHYLGPLLLRKEEGKAPLAADADKESHTNTPAPQPVETPPMLAAYERAKRFLSELNLATPSGEKSAEEGTCKICGKTFHITPEQLKAVRPAYCPECRETLKHTGNCVDCGKEVLYRKIPKSGLRCKECAERWANIIVDHDTCIVCGNSFDITNDEMMKVRPRRCPTCREARRMAMLRKQAATASAANGGPLS